MTELTGKTIANTYKQLLRVGVSTNTGVSAGLQTIETGDGTDSSFQLATGAAKFTGTLAVTGNVSLDGNIHVDDKVCASAFYGDGSNITGVTAVIAGDISVSNAIIGGNLYVSGTTTIIGNAAFKSNVTIGGDTVVNGTFVQAGAARFDSTVTVSGAATFKSTVTVEGAATFKNNVSVSGTFKALGASTFTAKAEFEDDVSVSGALDVAGNASIGGTFMATGAATFDNDVSVSGGLVVGGTVTIVGANVQAANARVCASAYHGDGSNITNISGAQISGDISVSNIKAAGNVSVGGAFYVADTVTIGGANLQATNAKVCASAYYGDGSNLTGIVASITGGRVAGNFAVSANLSVGGTSNLVGAVSVDGVMVLNNNLDMQDDDKILLGTGDDLQIYHNGSDSYIQDTGTGSLYLEGSEVQIRNNGGTEAMAMFTPDGEVKLRYDNTDRLKTTSTGVSVNGTLDVSGNTSIGGTSNITGKAEFKDDVSVSGNLITGGVITATSISVNGGLNISGTGQISGAATFASTVTVVGATHLQSTVSVAGVMTLNNDLDMQDNDKILLGTDDDLQIYHDGSNSRITEGGTGSLIMATNEFQFQNPAGDEVIMGGTADGEVKLYYDNTVRLKSTSAGVSVNGTLDVSGNVSVGGTFFAAGGITYDGDVSVSGDLAVGGNVSIGGTLSVTGAVSLASTLSVGGASHFASTVTVAGAAVFEDAVSVSGAVNIAGNTSVGGTFLTTGKAEFEDDVSVSGALIVGGTTTIAGATHLQSTVSIGGNTQLSGTLTVGVDDTGYDAKFFGATSGRYMLWDESADSLVFPDNAALIMGTGSDLKIFHNGSNSQINDLSTGNLQLLSNGAGVDIMKTDGEYMAQFATDGAVTLYHDNSAKLATDSAGVDITGTLDLSSHLDMPDSANIKLGTSDDLQIYHDGSNSYIKEDGTGSLLIWSTGTEIKLLGGASAETLADFNVDGAVELYHNNNLRLSTTTGGVQIDGTTASDFLVIKTTEAGAGSAPDVVLYRLSSSPADNDHLGKIEFRGRNDNSEDVQYGYISGQATDVSDGTEDGRLYFVTKENGTDTTNLTLNPDSAAFSDDVGIGVNPPARLLHLSATTADTSLIRIQNTNSHVAGVELLSGHGSWGVYNSDTVADALEFRDDSADVTRMIINSTGLVGINTTTPASLLEVKASALNRANGISLVGSGANDILYIYPSADNVATIEHLIDGSTTTGGVLSLNPQGGGVIGTHTILQFPPSVPVANSSGSEVSYYQNGALTSTDASLHNTPLAHALTVNEMRLYVNSALSGGGARVYVLKNGTAITGTNKEIDVTTGTLAFHASAIATDFAVGDRIGIKIILEDGATAAWYHSTLLCTLK
jgi:predicted acyltransferase (DUF342 family)